MGTKIGSQFSARLRDDDQQLVNEALPDLFPDIDLESTDIAGREILVKAVTKAVSVVQKQKPVSLESDLTKIKELEAEILRLSPLEQQLQEQFQKTLDAEKKYLDCKDELDREIQSGSVIAEQLEGLKRFKPVPNELRIVVEPFSLEVLKRYARKVSVLLKQEIRPGDVLISLFNRYITKKEVELDGFPFVISDSELRKIKQEFNEGNA